MLKATRNIEYRIYPTPRQIETMTSWLHLHCELYNAALQERRDAYQKCGISITYNQQQNSLPEVKEARPELTPLGSHALQETVRRVDRAYKAFFRRVKTGEKPGYPRFKSRFRFDSFTYPDPSGWKILTSTRKGGRLKVANIGNIKMRGCPRVALSDGTPRTLTVRRKNGRWYATISVKYDLQKLARNRVYSDRVVGLDAGCKDVVFTSNNDNIANPKFLSNSQKELKSCQKELSRKKRGSSNRNKARKKVISLHQKIFNQRKNFLHQLSASIVMLYSFVAIENLKLKNMTRSSKGTIENPGSNVKQKSGLNRSMLDAGVGLLFSMLVYKAVEAGSLLVKVNPNGTTQRCAMCGTVVQKGLSVRMHICHHCGFVAHRDFNAALNILFLGLSQAGREPIAEVWRGWIASSAKHETATMRSA